MAPRLFYWLSVIALFSFGGSLRLHVWHPAEVLPGFDEQVYLNYVDRLHEGGLANFPAVVRDYIVEVQQAEFVYLPPLRVAYLFPAYWIGKIFGTDPYPALRLVSALASCLFVVVSFVFARRWLGAKKGLAVLALVACAPVQIHLAQYAFIDPVAGLFAILALGCLWESLQQPRHLGWLGGTAISFFLLCCAKQETAVFVGLAFALGLLVAKRAGFAPERWPQWLALTVASLLALLVLTLLSGGFTTLAEAFTIYQERARMLPYSIQTGDGPWHRYLLEYLLVNPLVFLLAVGFALRGEMSEPRDRYLLGFVLITGAIMTSIPFSMNIRQTIMWDFPLALFAVQSVALLVAKLRAPHLWAGAIIALVCYSELRSYGTIFRGLYDTDPRFMLRAVRLLK